MLKVGDKVFVSNMPKDSFYKQVVGTVTKVGEQLVHINATHCMSKWGNTLKEHPTSCAIAVPICNVGKI